MKTDLYRSDIFKCSINSLSHKITEQDKYYKTISINGGVQKISWLIEGDAYMVWPNREGEGFTVSQAVKKLASLENTSQGVSISYPATASVMAFLIRNGDGESLLIYMDRDEAGRVCDIRLQRENDKALSINITAIHQCWHCLRISDETVFSNYLEVRNNKKDTLKHQFQLGLIGPYGKCSVPEDLGFNVIPQIAGLINENYNPDTSCIHIFGYARGHDILYPDYSPSQLLGGQKLLKSALIQTKDMGFETSFYLNGRIVDSEALIQFPRLKEALLRDNRGSLIEEKYQNRIFYVVNPSSIEWGNCLLEWAQILADCGADTVQLDQLGGRAAAKECGDVWGEGYNRIIDRIHNLGMKVWIQGVSDYYRADRFEMTFRDLNILEDGTLRGGNPFGKNDLSLIKIFAKNTTFIVTKSKIKKLENSDDFDFIIDYPDYKGELPLYNKQYLKMLNNAGAALR